jgi:lysophospholipase L1-like esterase
MSRVRQTGLMLVLLAGVAFAFLVARNSSTHARPGGSSSTPATGAPVKAASKPPATPPVAGGFVFQPRETVVFFGDGMTFDGLYTIYTELLLRTRRPDVEWRFINAGQSGDALAAPGKAMDRFTSDVAAHEPTLIIAGFGMNDGGFAPFSEPRFARFREGVKSLLERTRSATKARLILLTPVPFDHPKSGEPDVRPEESYGLKTPFAGYDHVLAAYSGWLAGLARGERNVLTVDLHTALREHLIRRRRVDPEFTLQPDRVRPNATGHMVIAAALARALGLPAVVDECMVDAAALRAPAGQVDGLRREGTGIAFAWRTRLPLPQDARWDEASVALEGLVDRLNEYRLRITGLPDGEYQLLADDTLAAHLSARELAAGVDLRGLKAFPTHQRAEQALVYLEERRKLSHKLKVYPPAGPAGRDAEIKRDHALQERVRDLSAPMPVHVRVVPVK